MHSIWLLYQYNNYSEPGIVDYYIKSFSWKAYNDLLDHKP